MSDLLLNEVLKDGDQLISLQLESDFWCVIRLLGTEDHHAPTTGYWAVSVLDDGYYPWTLHAIPISQQTMDEIDRLIHRLWKIRLFL
jgi:hypothetical protein